MFAAAAVPASWRLPIAWLPRAACATALALIPTADALGAFPGDNGRIAVVSSWLGCGGRGGIATIRPDGTGLRMAGSCGSAWGSAEWFADGRRLLTMDSTRGTPLVMRSDGTRRRVVDLEPAGHPWAASPSPDGRSFAYNLPTRSSEMSAPAEIWRARLDGTRARHRRRGMPGARRWAEHRVRITDGLSVRTRVAGSGPSARPRFPGAFARLVTWRAPAGLHRLLSLRRMDHFRERLATASPSRLPTRTALELDLSTEWSGRRTASNSHSAAPDTTTSSPTTRS